MVVPILIDSKGSANVGETSIPAEVAAVAPAILVQVAQATMVALAKSGQTKGED